MALLRNKNFSFHSLVSHINITYCTTQLSLLYTQKKKKKKRYKVKTDKKVYKLKKFKPQSLICILFPLNYSIFIYRKYTIFFHNIEIKSVQKRKVKKRKIKIKINLCTKETVHEQP